MIDYHRFVTNIYDPRLPDSDSKLVSETADPKKREQLLKFVRDLIDQYEIGEPCETYSCSQKQLFEANIVGLYRCDRTTDLGAIKLFGDFKVVKPEEPEEKIEEPKKKFQMNFRKRAKQLYKFPAITQDKAEQLTIDDYVPPKPIIDKD